MPYKYISYLFLLSCSFSITSNASNQTITVNAWKDVTTEMVSESPKIKSVCGKIEFSDKSKKTYKPEFPEKGFRKNIQGYSVFEFTISSEGKTQIIGNILKSDDIFEKQGLNYLKKLEFIVPNDWSSTCGDQIYRVGYAFRILTECTGTEFPKPVIGICSVGMMADLRTGKLVEVKFKGE